MRGFTVTIHIIGDSHGNIFHNIPNFSFNQMPMCAHNLLKESHKKQILTYVEAKVKEGDHVLLIFGEIDCRLHFHYQSQKQNRPISELIDETIQRYGAFGKILSDMGIDYAFYNIVPTGTWKHLRYSEYATCEMELRQRIYREFHDKLAEYCRKNGRKLVDIWDSVADEDGFTKHEFRQDEVHLNTKALPIILKEIEQVFEK